jgi:TRAP-type mannitol/chloroaromatic compound transport system permease small subunit
MDETSGGTLGDMIMSLGSGVVWVIQNIALSFYNIGYAITHPSLWLDWSDKQAVMRFVYYGGSVEFFFAVFSVFLLITAIGIWRSNVLWTGTRVLEGFTNTVGRLAAWAGFLMVIQQVMIIFLQRIFARPDITISFGIPISFDVSWWAEELKLYNALVVALCLAYTFVQRGHVRVDLIYAPLSYRAKKMVDMFGSLFFMIPMATLMWMYSWFFLWRHLIVPKPSASDQLDRLLMKSRALRWNIETIGFSPQGFNAYFLFKILIVALCGMIFIQAWAFFWRSFLEWREGEESDGKHLDLDNAGDDAAVPEDLAVH